MSTHKLDCRRQTNSHVYLASMQELQARWPVELAWCWLDQKERAAFHAIKAQSRRLELVYGRFLIRHLLSRHTGLPASSIQLKKTQLGKLLLCYPGTKVHFNLAHSDDVIACCVNETSEVGIDVEVANPDLLPEIARIAQRQFTPTEASLIRQVDGSARCNAFYRIWTCKEAALKALGVGLSIPLSSVDTTKLNNSQILSVFLQGKQYQLCIHYLHYCHHHNNPGPPIHLAIACNGPAQRLMIYRGEKLYRCLASIVPSQVAKQIGA